MNEISSSTRDNKPSLIVALGASAGGVNALRTVFAAIDPHLPAAFVVVQHLEPGAEDLAREVIAACSHRQVVVVDHSMKPAAGTVYIVPPRTILSFEGGTFTTRPAADQNERMNEIDFAFGALALGARRRLLAVLLSGEGNDGARGLEAVHEQGGLTMVQLPETSEHPSMAKAAIGARVVDRILSLEQIAEEISAQIHYAERVTGEGPTSHLRDQIGAALTGICEVLQRQTNHDFKYYKSSTLIRRVRRRMQLLHLDSVEAYLERLDLNAGEAEALFRELLINVTSFFRDPEAFDYLAQHVLSKAIGKRGSDSKYRIWIPGCSTGEEVYTLAILVREQLEKLSNPPPVQIIATDIDERALNSARKGVYSLGIERSVSKERLNRYFTRAGGSYHINKELREMCLFSAHNLINDPPFSRVDLISCRNVLIYIGANLQKKLLPVFHYALRPGGHLFLGTSESLTSHEDLFRVLSTRFRVARRRPVAVRAPSFSSQAGIAYSSHLPDAPRMTENDLHLISQRIVLDEFSPRYVVVNEEGKIISVSGGIRDWLEPSEGSFSNNIFKLTPTELRASLRAAFKEACHANRRTKVRTNRRMKNGIVRVGIVIEPLPKLGDDHNLFIIVFREEGPAHEVVGPVPSPRAPDVDYVDRLERELAATRQELDRSIQDIEASNEELKSSNEELLSMNEELQSANEELEASKEEVQKSNYALQRTNSDLENLLASTQIATLFLDRELCIRGFTPAVTDIYNVQESDVGRRISDFTSRALDQPDITLAPGEVEIRMPDDRVYLRRTLPYVTLDKRNDGVVLTFINVTEVRKGERRYQALIEASGQMVWSTSPEGRVIEDSPSWRAFTGQTTEQWLGTGWLDVVHPDDRDESIRVWRECVATRKPYDVDYRVLHVSGRWRWTRARGIPLFTPDRTLTGWIGMNIDIDERKNAQLNYERNVDASPAILWITERDGSCTYLSKQWLEFTGQTKEQSLGFGWTKAVHPEDAEEAGRAFTTASNAQVPYYAEFRVRTRDGSYRWVIDAGNPRFDPSGTYLGMAGTVFDIHERRLAEQAIEESQGLIRESEAKFRTITEALPQMVWSTLPDGTHDFFNKRWYEFVGLDPGMPFDHRWADLIHPEDRPKVLQAWEHSLASGDFYQAEMRLRHASGRYRWVLARALPVREENGTILRWMGTSTDIHDRRMVAEALELSEERYRVLTELSPQIMWAGDGNGAINYCNQAWIDYSGMSAADTAGDGWLHAVHSDQREEISQSYAVAIDNLQTFEAEVPFRRRDGEYRWFFAKVSPVRDSRGLVDRWVGIAIDIHESRTARERILVNEKLLKTITDNTTSSLFMMDKTGHPTFMNPAAEKLTGYTIEEIRHRPLHYSVHYKKPDGTFYPMEECPIDNAQAELTHLQDQDEVFVDKAGRIFPVSFSVSPLETDGNIEGSVLEFRDVSAQKEAEQQLRNAKQTAEAANEAKSTFLANMSHEIRTPLGAIVGFSELLGSILEPESEASGYVSRISRNSAQLSQLIDELLDLSKIEAKRLLIEHVNVDLTTSIDDVFAAVSLQAAEKNIELAVERKGDIPKTLSTDPMRLRQILINLIGNAVKFSENGRITVELNRASEKRLEIRIIDCGIGLSEVQKQRLFKPFMQADSSITRKYGGTGLGLALSRDLARLLGGDIVLESSEPDKGSTFVLTLPTSVEVVPNGATREQTIASTEHPLTGKQILVVDDSPDNQLLVSHFLERSGATLDRASDGLEAVEKANSGRYDVILMDLQMPRMDGYTALKTLRDQKYQKPIVALTAHALKSERDRCLESGFDGYVTKPIDRRTLVRTIQDLTH